MTTVERTLQIEASVAQVFGFWKNFAQFGEILPGVERVTLLSDTQSEWTVRAPFNTLLTFTATTTEMREHAYMRWESTHGAGPDDVTSGGELFFEAAPDGQTTNVRMRFQYEIPSSSAQRVIETLRALGYPDREFDQNLAILKEAIEQS